MTTKQLLVYAHPFLIAIAPALFLWSINFGEVGYDKALITIGALLAFSLITVGALYVILRSLPKASIAASAILFITFYFAYIFESLFIFNIVLPWRWSVPIAVGAILLTIYLVHHTTKDLAVLNKVLTIIAGTFVLLSVIQIGNEFRTQHVTINTDKPEFTATSTEGELRDIYYIILDGHSSPAVVKDVFGYGGIDTFTAFLESENFFVATGSRSNYAATRLSLPSSLNMQLLDSPKNAKKFDLMFEDHAVKDVLKAYGYTYLHFGSNSFTYYNRYADKNFNVGTLSPYQQSLWRRSLLFPLTTFGSRYISYDFFANLGGFDPRQEEWERVHFQLDTLQDISSEYEEPLFVFAHFNPPKGNVFDTEGNLLPETEVSKKYPAELYVEQMSFIHQEMEKLITSLKNSSDPQPIIIIQGDHGYKFIADPDLNDPAVLTELIPETISVAELLVSEDAYSFPIFNAYYFPDIDDTGLYSDISPVNSFRLLFNTYFNEDFELLEDKSYVPDPDNGTTFVPFDS